MAKASKLVEPDKLEVRLSAVLSVAAKAECLKARCGALLVREDLIATRRTLQELGAGFNGPPQRNLALRTCHDSAPSKKKPRADRTCCVHAEMRALLRALHDKGALVIGSTLYFARVGGKGELLPSGKPYCTACSRIALDLGVKDWVLWHRDGARLYPAREYHELSARYDEESGG